MKNRQLLSKTKQEQRLTLSARRCVLVNVAPTSGVSHMVYLYHQMSSSHHESKPAQVVRVTLDFVVQQHLDTSSPRHIDLEVGIQGQLG